METLKDVKEIKEINVQVICVDCGSKEVVQNEFKTDLCIKCVKRNKLIIEQNKKYTKKGLELKYIAFCRKIKFWENQLTNGITYLDPEQKGLAKVPEFIVLTNLDTLKFERDKLKDQMGTVLEYSEEKIKELFPEE